LNIILKEPATQHEVMILEEHHTEKPIPSISSPIKKVKFGPVTILNDMTYQHREKHTKKSAHQHQRKNAKKSSHQHQRKHTKKSHPVVSTLSERSLKQAMENKKKPSPSSEILMKNSWSSSKSIKKHSRQTRTRYALRKESITSYLRDPSLVIKPGET
jgi:hypothetical protein